MAAATVASFLQALEQQPDSDTVTNPYRSSHCVENLRHYLLQMQQFEPHPVLLVGEAPGYKGCGLTGIPFSSGKIFQQLDHPLLQRLKKQLILPRIEAENTASIVWRHLAEQSVTPLFWNAYPFHPHPADNRNSNRAPSRREIAEGEGYLKMLVALFQPRQIAGVGHAGTACARQAFPDSKVSYIRHPSYGGKRDFIAGVERLYRGAC